MTYFKTFHKTFSRLDEVIEETTAKIEEAGGTVVSARWGYSKDHANEHLHMLPYVRVVFEGEVASLDLDGGIIFP